MAGKAVISGSLAFIGLADLFQLLGGNASTGVLRITSPYSPNPGTIYFEKGNPVNGACGTLKGLDAVYSLFGWTEGNFEFHEDEIRPEKVITSSRMQVVLDALRMLDDGSIKVVGPVDETAEGAPAATAGDRGEGPQIIRGPLVDYLHIIDEEVFKDGERIVREKGHGKWIWVILEGHANISRETPNGPVVVTRLGEGCFIGNFTALVFKEYARSANVVAQGEVRLGLLDTEHLSSEYTALSNEFRRLLISLDRRLRKITDRVVTLSTKQEKGELSFGEENRLIRQGSSGEDLYMISEGEAYLVANSRKGPLHLMTLEKDDFLGSVPFTDMGQEPRGAGVFVSKDAKLEKIDPQPIQEEYNRLSGTIRNLIYNAGICSAVTTRMVRRMYEGR
ncbi:MAG: DUF4388 domain-containing protein [Deltaproteobacteria bacterium]|nr:DUF4388 domain-containing protein [Deltaproteobacteria bacterium]